MKHVHVTTKTNACIYSVATLRCNWMHDNALAKYFLAARKRVGCSFRLHNQNWVNNTIPLNPIRAIPNRNFSFQST